MNRVTTSVLNTLAATAGDISVSDRSLNITGCPSMNYAQMKTAGSGLVKSLLATPLVWVVTPTNAANSTYTLQITQYVASAGHIITRVLSYTTPASGSTATTICDFLRLQLATYTDIEVTGSGTATLILTGSSTSCIFTVTNTSTATMTIASGMATGTWASNSTATPTSFVTAAPHTWLVGQTITITATTPLKVVDGTYRIATVGATTFTLETVNGAPLAGTATTAGTFVLVAQVGSGSYTDLVALGVTGATAGATYASIPFVFADGSGLDSNLNQATYPINMHTLYVDDTATNYQAFSDRIAEVLGAFPASGSTYPDPELVAVPH